MHRHDGEYLTQTKTNSHSLYGRFELLGAKPSLSLSKTCLESSMGFENLQYVQNWSPCLHLEFSKGALYYVTVSVSFQSAIFG